MQVISTRTLECLAHGLFVLGLSVLFFGWAGRRIMKKKVREEGGREEVIAGGKKEERVEGSGS